MPRFAVLPALAGLVLVSFAPIVAQDGPGSSSFPELGPKKPAVEPERRAPAAVGQVDPAAAEPAAREAEAQLFEAGDALNLHNIPNAELPAITAEPLPAGTLVWMLRRDEAPGFSRVSVLGGIEGWVHGDFVRPLEGGFAEVSGDKVAFRYEPETTGWPVDRMRKGTVLRLLEKRGDWYRVLGSPEVGALVETKSLTLVGGVPIRAGGELAGFEAGSALADRATKQQEARLDEWQKQRARFIAEATRSAALAEMIRAISDVEAQLDREERRPDMRNMALADAEKLAVGLHTKATELELRDDEPAGLRLTALDLRLERLGLIREAAIKREELNTVLVPSTTDAVARAHPDTNLPKFAQSGWLRYRPGNYSSFQLVKGGQILCYVTCADARYRLEDYVGCQLGLQGDTGHPEAADFKVVDVARLFVLSSR